MKNFIGPVSFLPGLKEGIISGRFALGSQQYKVANIIFATLYWQELPTIDFL